MAKIGFLNSQQRSRLLVQETIQTPKFILPDRPGKSKCADCGEKEFQVLCYCCLKKICFHCASAVDSKKVICSECQKETNNRMEMSQ